MVVIEGYKLDDIAVEALVDMRNAQPPRDRMKYFEAAVEGVVNPQTKVKLVQKLYDDLFAHSDIDFGEIPESKGDLTRYKHYKVMVDTINNLELVLANTNNEEYDLTEKLCNMLISCRSDFEYGYKFEIELIKTTYCTLVVALHHMIDISILKYIDQLKQKTGISFQSTPTKCDRLLLVRSVKGIINSYNKGEWTEMINSFKKGRNNWLGAIGAASKAIGLTTVSSAGVALTGAGVAVVTIIALAVTLMMVRKMVYVFYSSAYKIDESVKRSKTFLEYTMKNDSNQSMEATIKQEKILNIFNRIHDVIETKIFAADDKASKAMTKADKARFSVTDIGPENIDKVEVNEEDVSTSLPEQSSNVSSESKPFFF